jgi:hypothetical protein
MEGDNIINIQVPSRTAYEYQRDNKDRISIYKRERNQYIKACKELHEIEVLGCHPPLTDPPGSSRCQPLYFSC